MILYLKKRKRKERKRKGKGKGKEKKLRGSSKGKGDPTENVMLRIFYQCQLLSPQINLLFHPFVSHLALN
jgi:hypothetical protein